MEDPIVEEVSRIRDEHAARFNYDLDAIYADLKRLERESKIPRVSLVPRIATADGGQTKKERREALLFQAGE